MANPSVTNVTGSNPGPNVDALPDTVQMPTGNVWKMGVFSLTLSPASVAANTSAEQTFASTGIGLLTTDVVFINKPTLQPGLGVVNVRVSASDTLAISFGNFTGTAITPTSSQVYTLGILRVQPNWTAPATGNQIDW